MHFNVFKYRGKWCRIHGAKLITCNVKSVRNWENGSMSKFLPNKDVEEGSPLLQASTALGAGNFQINLKITSIFYGPNMGLPQFMQRMVIQSKSTRIHHLLPIDCP